jgi:nucleoside-diphosphate-sugar epimerase
MAILITGGSGFIGLKLSKALLERGNQVILFDIMPPEKQVKQARQCSFVKGNISNWAEVCNVVRDSKIEHIFHLAAMLSAQCEANPWAAFQVNALGTYHVLEASRLFGVKKVIFTSSMGAYGPVPSGVVNDETVQRPQIMYGVTKVFGELLGLYYHRRFSIDFRGVRFPQLLGPGVKSEGYGQYNPKMIESAIRGIPFEAWVTEKTSIPIMYLKDAVRCLLELFEAEENKIQTRIYNVGQILPSPTAGDLLEEIKKHFHDVSITFKPDPKVMELNKTLPRQLSDEEARAEWGWLIHYGLKEMVEDFIKDFGHNLS